MNHVTYQDAFVQCVRLLQQCEECRLCEEHRHTSAGERGFRQLGLIWSKIESAPKDGSRVLCWARSFEHPIFLVWKTNPRIVHEHNEKRSPELASSYFGDPDEMDDYELAEAGKGPTHWLSLPPVPADAAKEWNPPQRPERQDNP